MPDEVEPRFKGGTKTAPKPKAKKSAPKAKATKAAPKPKAAKKAAPKKDESGIVRSKSTVSKDGTKKCEFDGKEYPVTAFPTVRQADGSYVRGPVTRANLPAHRAARKAEREAAKAAKAKAKAASKK